MTETSKLIDAALLLIAAELKRSTSPLLAWSGGKDSQVLLALVQVVAREQGYRFSVAHFRPFNHPSKHLFADLIISMQDLQVVEIKPAFRDAVATGDHIEIVEAYQIAPGAFLYYPIEAEPDYAAGPGSHCAVEKINEPTSEEPGAFDAVFIGHRGDDVDPAHGAIPLKADVVEASGVRFVYPLKDWSEGDIWDASRILNVAQNGKRYADGRMDWNADYYEICTKCLHKGDSDFVICPKIQDHVYRLGKLISLEDRRRIWRDQFINLES